MLPFQQRVVDKATRDGEIELLRSFIETSPLFKNLPMDEKGRLTKQLIIMEALSKVLGESIAAFAISPDDSVDIRLLIDNKSFSTKTSKEAAASLVSTLNR